MGNPFLSVQAWTFLQPPPSCLREIWSAPDTKIHGEVRKEVGGRILVEPPWNKFMKKSLAIHQDEHTVEFLVKSLR